MSEKTTEEKLQELADRIGLEVGEEKEVEIQGRPWVMRRVQ